MASKPSIEKKPATPEYQSIGVSFKDMISGTLKATSIGASSQQNISSVKSQVQSQSEMPIKPSANSLSVEPKKDTPKIEFTQQNFVAAWHNYMSNVKDENPAQAVALGVMNPSFVDKNMIFEFGSSVELENFNVGIKNSLLRFLQKELSDSEVNVVVKLQPKIVATLNNNYSTPTSSKEKYDVLCKQNPALEELKKVFDAVII